MTATKVSNLVFDVGMHQGEDTAFYLAKGFRVVAFEADPGLAQACRARFSKDIEAGRLTLVEGAIFEPAPGQPMPASITFFRNKDNSVWGTVDAAWAQRNEYLGTSNERIEVKVINFADCLREFGVPHFMKIDIEGMDRVCLRALASFDVRPDYVSIEAEKVDFDSLQAELRLLEGLGYSSFKAVQQAGISTQHEPNPAREGRYTGLPFIEGCSGLFGADLPGEWQNAGQVLQTYRRIFSMYRWFGDKALIPRYWIGRMFIKVLIRVLNRPIPGWYDTHARHQSAPVR